MSEHGLTLDDLDDPDIDGFDAAEFLVSEQAVAAYLTAALETNDASLLAAAVGNVARARGMAEIAKASGLAREGLYKALRPNSQPRLETITRVLGALGVRLVAEVIPLAERVVPAKLPNVALVTDKPVRRSAGKLPVASINAFSNTKVDARPAVRKAPAKSSGKYLGEPLIAKRAAKSAPKPTTK